MWSYPRQITERLENSYKLETLDGTALDRIFHARRLRGFSPREGMQLAEDQRVFMKKIEQLEHSRTDDKGSKRVGEPDEETDKADRENQIEGEGDCVEIS